MKRIILSSVVSAAVLFGTTGCGDKKNSEHATQAVKSEISAQTIKKRQTAFDAKIKSYHAYGFDTNKTSENTYRLKVADAPKAVNALAAMLNLNTLDDNDKEIFQSLVKDASFDVDVDWKKYAANDKESVMVYYLGNGRESKPLADMLKAKKAAAALTYNANDQLTAMRIEDIDETLKEDNNMAHIVLKGAHIAFDEPFTAGSPKQAYTIYGGTVKAEFTDTEENETVSLSYDNPVCKIKKQNSYLGEASCTFPTISINLDTDMTNGADMVPVHVDTLISNTEFKNKTVSHNKKVRTDMAFKVKSVDISGKSEKDPKNHGTVTINNIDFAAVTDNVDEALMKSYMDFMQHPPKDQKKVIQKTMDFIANLYSNGLTVDGVFNIKNIKGDLPDATFAMEAYQSKGKASFDQTINYQDNSSIGTFDITDKKTNKAIFDLKNFRYGFALKDLSNFIPAFLQFSGELAAAAESNQSAPMPADTEQKLAKMGTDLVHNGFGISIDPLGWEMLAADAKGKTVNIGKTDFNLDINLSKNNVPLNANNPMTAMMLLPYLHTDGKLVIPKKDLEQLAQNFPPQIMMMAMMFAKYEGDNAVFVLKFENGHLMVNGKPVM
jgi:hypothetical protein